MSEERADYIQVGRHKKPKNEALVSVRLPAYIMRELEAIAFSEDRPLSSVVRRILGERFSSVTTSSGISDMNIKWHQGT